MHYFTKPKGKSARDWIKDNHAFMDAYYAATRDDNMKAEIEQLEEKYIRQHLADIVGEYDADRIMSERGY